MQGTKRLLDQLRTWAKQKVICITQNNLCTNFFQVMLAHGFYGSSRTNRHKDGGMDIAVNGLNGTGPCLA